MSKPPEPVNTVDGSLSVELRQVFGENLKAARIKAKLTQTQLSERTGIGQRYVSRIEAGEMNITLSTLARLAEAVGGDATVMLMRNPPRRPKA